PAPSLCGGVATVSWTATSSCEPPVVKTRTFTVLTAPPIVIHCAPSKFLGPCSSTSAIQAAYTAWATGCTFTGGCGATDNHFSVPALPANAACNGALLVFTYHVQNPP